MMDIIQQIDEAFKHLLTERGAAKKMGISANYKGQLAWKIRAGRPVDLSTKLKLLQRAGIRFETADFTRSDIIAAITFTIRTSQAAREWGAAYVFEKWQGGRVLSRARDVG